MDSASFFVIEMCIRDSRRAVRPRLPRRSGRTASVSGTSWGVSLKGTDRKSTRLNSSHLVISYAVDWDLIHKSPTPREAPKINTEERTIWDERTMLAALQTIENPALHLAVHMSMILSLREGEILGLQPGDCLLYTSRCV